MRDGVIVQVEFHVLCNEICKEKELIEKFRSNLPYQVRSKQKQKQNKKKNVSIH